MDLGSLSPVHSGRSQGGSGTWQETQLHSVRRKRGHSFTFQVFAENTPGIVLGASYSKMRSPRCVFTVKDTSRPEKQECADATAGSPSRRHLGSSKGIPDLPETGKRKEPKHGLVPQEPNRDHVAKRGVQHRCLFPREKARGQFRLEVQKRKWDQQQDWPEAEHVWGSVATVVGTTSA